jgi:hypothetical protein
MKQSKLQIGMAVICLFTVCVTACVGASSAAETNAVTETPPRPAYWPWTVGAEAGTTGAGLFGSWRFDDHLGVRAGFDYFQTSQREPTIEDITYSTTLRLLSEPLTLDIYPWTKHSFHSSVGMLFNQNELTGTAGASGTITIGGHPFPATDVGTLNLKIDQQLVNPYLSIGGNFLYFDHAHHWALGGELGVAYTGEPSVSLTREGGRSTAPLIDQAVKIEQQRVQDYADQFQWWPVVKLMVSYSF